MNFNLFAKIKYLRYKFKRLDKKGLKFYQGKYAHGNALFTYREGLDAYIYNGKFYYEHRYQNYGKSSTRISGLYQDNLKENVWRYCNRESHSKTLLTVNYFHGIHQGMYLLRIGDVGFFSFRLRCMLKLFLLNNKVIGPIKVLGNDYTIQANCDENGRPNGKWIMNVKDSYSEYTHIEEWEHGVLNACYRIDVLTGKHTKSDEKIRKKIMHIVRSQAYGLESRIGGKRGAWDGSIHRGV